ncbi:MAG: hypothetical protein KGK14_10910, partial [Bacteroidota bacterium]|nr:hypothetical protein [Bacteroidota bacterium]
VRTLLSNAKYQRQAYFAVVNQENICKGIINAATINNYTISPTQNIGSLPLQKAITATADMNLSKALEKLLAEQTDVLVIVDTKKSILGFLSKQNMLNAYQNHILNEHEVKKQISLKRNALKILLKGKKLVQVTTTNIFIKNNNQTN